MFLSCALSKGTSVIAQLVRFVSRRLDYWRNIALVLKKSPSWCLRGRQQQGYKQTRVSDAAGNRHSRRLAAYDGATRPFGVSCSTTSASKIRFLKTTCYVSSTATSVSILCVRSCVHPTAKR